MSAGFLDAEWLEGYNFHIDFQWGTRTPVTAKVPTDGYANLALRNA